MKLKYLGNAFLPGVPARDLTEAEVEQYGGVAALVASGVYAEDSDKPVAKKETKEADNGRS